MMQWIAKDEGIYQGRFEELLTQLRRMLGE